MDPHLHAAADKLIFDLAMAKYAASIVPKGALRRPLTKGGPTLRDTLVERAALQEGHAAAVRNFFDGKLLDGVDFADEQSYRREKKRLATGTPLKEVFASFARSRDRLRTVYAEVGEEQAGQQWGEESLADRLLRDAHHLEAWGLEVAEVVPEVRLDPMLLNWALGADLEGDAAGQVRQERLFALVQAELDEEDDEIDDAHEPEDEQ